MSSEVLGPSGLALTSWRDGPTSVRITVSGDLDIAGAPVFEAFIANSTGDDDSVVLDARAVEFIDSHGLRSLLIACDLFPDRLQIVASEATRRVAEIAGVSDLLPFESVDLTA